MYRTDTDRRQALARLAAWAALAALAPAAREARAFSLADLSHRDAAAGLKAALEQGADVAVRLLGTTDGFWSNDRVRIPLPEWLQRGERMLRLMGRGRDLEELKLGVNRAAEQAVPEAKHLLVDAVRSMNVRDAKSILAGGDDSVTRFFAEKTRAPLTARFLPVVTKVTERIGLARQYNSLAGQGERLGLVKPEQARIERHVTGKALDGLYLVIGEEEKRIREDPLSAGAAIAKKVFGALK
ncbi:MAG: DUF4197 domain-containing protein [Burkholderiaceae bacterium]